MYRYILKRLGMIIPVLLGVSFVIFTLMHYAPGDPVRMLLGNSATNEQVEAMRESMGLNEPLLVQYFIYMKNLLLHGDLGTSYVHGSPVLEMIVNRLPVTISLAFLGIAFAVVLGVPAGIISAVKQYSFVDNAVMVIALLGISMPNFWLGIIMILVFSRNLGWFPVSGWGGQLSWVLPTVSVGASSAASIARMTRSSMLEIIQQDYISTARAKGQKESVVILRHGLKNSLIPIITSAGLLFGMLLGGAVVAETVFAIPGIGKLMVDAISQRDYPIVTGTAIIIAAMLGIVNLLVDISYAFVDPRIKSQYRSVKKKKTAGEVKEHD